MLMCATDFLYDRMQNMHSVINYAIFGSTGPAVSCGRPKKCAQCEPPLLALGNGQDHKVAAQCARHEAPSVSPTTPTKFQVVQRRRL